MEQTKINKLDYNSTRFEKKMAEKQHSDTEAHKDAENRTLPPQTIKHLYPTKCLKSTYNTNIKLKSQ